MTRQLLKIASLLLTGLIAGTFFYGTFTVIPTFYEVPSDIHLQFRTALMKHNALIVMWLVVLAIIAIAWYTWQMRKTRRVFAFCLLALLFTVASLVLTRLGSVPINMQIKTWSPHAPPANWLDILETWDFYNLIRTILSIASFISLLISNLWTDTRTVSVLSSDKNDYRQP